LARPDLLGIHCCLGSFSEKWPVDPRPWKTGLGQGLWIVEFGLCSYSVTTINGHLRAYEKEKREDR
jgi:hypothetical protein